MPIESLQDPRDTLVRTKYFTIRPMPLEQWLWRQHLSPSAERVFWLHWQEGMRNKDWCSAIPIRRVASLCSLNTSSVTRAYQKLAALGLVHRQDPGRDPDRPFEQAVAVTEVRIPKQLIEEWHQYPNRRPAAANASTLPAPGSTHVPALPVPSTSKVEATTTNGSEDPLGGLNGRERHRALGAIRARMSTAERRYFDDAIRTRQGSLSFDPDTQLTQQDQRVLTHVAQLAGPATHKIPPPAGPTPRISNPPTVASRKLTLLEVACLRRQLQQQAGQERGVFLLREVAWAVEQGALNRFTTLHATRIALKKIRLGLWTRPHRMPPNWSLGVASNASSVCAAAG
jgi:hypothetical protein